MKEYMEREYTERRFKELQRYECGDGCCGAEIVPADDGYYYAVEDVEKLLKELFSTST